MSTQTSYPHIEQRSDGKLWLIGTQTKVLEVALDRLAHHWDADEIQRQHPHLTLGQIRLLLHDYPATIRELGAAITMHPRQPRAYAYLSQAYAAAGRPYVARKAGARFDAARAAGRR